MEAVSPIGLLGACLIIAVYAAIDPAGVVGQSGCCVVPTSESETSDGFPYQQPTEAAFSMSLYNAQLTDFGGDEVGEYSTETGNDSCHDDDPNSGFAPVVSVSTPEPEYYWSVGQLGKWDGEPGSLDTVSPTPAYNGFGYDAVGYNQAAATAYREDLEPLGKLPCGTEFYQGMYLYCPTIFQWALYAVNDLTAQINPTYVVDCKNSVCATIYH